MRANTQRLLRQLHRYLGVFFAPAILFFAFSGMLQTVHLNDATPAGPAPAWIKWIAAIHKDQEPPHLRKPAPAPAAKAVAEKPAAPREAEQAQRFVPLKLFVLLLALGLIFSTLLGLWIALTVPGTRQISAITLIAGIVVPIVLLLF